MSSDIQRSAVHQAFVNAREGRLRAGWRLLAGLVVLTVGAVGAVVAVSVLQSVLVATDVGRLPDLYAGQFVAYAVLTAVILALGWFVDRRVLPDLGLGGPEWWRNLAFGLVLGLFMTTAVFLVELAAGYVTVEGVLVGRPGLGFGSALSPVTGLLLTLLLFVGVGVFEELLIRGYLMTNLAEGLNGIGPVDGRGAIAVAAVLTSALFGVLHLGNPNATPLSAFNIAVVGLFLAGAYVATDDLGVSIGVHVTWNFSLSSVYGFPVSGLTTPATLLDVRQGGPPLITGGRFGPEAGLVVYLALAVAVGLTWWWVRRVRGPVGFPVAVAVPDLRTDTVTDHTTDERREPTRPTSGGED